MHTVTLQFNVRPLGGPRKNLTTHDVAVLSLAPDVRPRPFSYSGVALTNKKAQLTQREARDSLGV